MNRTVNGLHITTGGSLVLPESLVTERLGVVGASGYGKTHLLTVIAEELLEREIPVVIIDPEGVFGGLRSSFDGKNPGYKIVVLGGREGDLALQPTAGAAIADVVVATRQSMVLDLSQFDDEDQETDFVDAFCQRIYAKNPRIPLHIVIDEVDKFAPETPTSKGQMRSMKSVKNIVQRGRNRALGSTICSQRPAVIKKDILYQVRCLFAFNLGGPLDQDAIAKWMLRNAGLEKKERDHFTASLPKLPRGTAWCWSPVWLNAFEQVHIRERRTFDSSKTPELADLTRQRTKQQVDLTELQRLMAATIEQTDDEDVDRLRARLRELEAQVAGKPAPPPTPQPMFSEIERAQIAQVGTALDRMDTSLQANIAALKGIAPDLALARKLVARVVELIKKPPRQAKVVYLKEPAADATEATGRRRRRAPASPADPAPTPKRTPEPTREPRADGEPNLKRGAREMLANLAAFGGTLTKNQLGTLCRIKPKGSTMSSYLSNLRLAGLIDDDKEKIWLTPAGTTQAGPQKRIKTDELVARWGKVLKLGARQILDQVIAAGADGTDRETLGRKLDIEPNGSTMSSYLSNLRLPRLIVEDQEDRIFMGEALQLLQPRRARRTG